MNADAFSQPRSADNHRNPRTFDANRSHVMDTCLKRGQGPGRRRTLVPVNEALTPEASIVTSAAFRRARLQAERISTSAERLERLLDAVKTKSGEHLALRAPAARADLDHVCSVVDAHLVGSAKARRQEQEPLSIAASARLRLVVAALVYLVDVDDVIPDSRPDGLTDDVVLLRWAAEMVQGEQFAA